MKKKVLLSIVAVALFAVAMAFNSQGKVNAFAEPTVCDGHIYICESQMDQLVEDTNQNCDIAAYELTVYENC